MPVIATHSGLRGLPGTELTAEVLERAIGGFVEVLRRHGLAPSLAVARDERPAGEPLTDEAIEIARSCGADVIDFGVVSTPAAKLAARSHRLGGAMVVTGSHLEPEQNGLKFALGPSCRPLDASGLPSPPDRDRRRRRGRLRRDSGAAAGHVAAVFGSGLVSPGAGAITADFRGGAGPGPELLIERLGCRPASAAADVTFCLDADADRVDLIDELGHALDPEVTLALVLLATGATTIVKGADTSRTIEALANRRGATVHVVPPGEVHLFDGLEALGGDLAGEGNGGVILPSVGPGRDGLAASAAILSLLGRGKRPLSALAAELPRFGRKRSSISCPDPAAAQAALDRLAARRGLGRHDRLKGLQVESGGAWGLVRQSATEPVVRITTEAGTQGAAEALHEELRGALRDEGPAA